MPSAAFPFPPQGDAGAPMAAFAGRVATGLREVVDLRAHPEALRSGWWAVAATFEGSVTGYRFEHVRTDDIAAPRPGGGLGGPAGHAGPGGRTGPGGQAGPGGWTGPEREGWSSSLDRDRYLRAVGVIRERIAAGDVYQVNLCRMLTAPLPAPADPIALAAVLSAGNPSPYQGVLQTGEQWVVTASPELFLARSGDRVTSSPMKGTAPPGRPFLPKDVPENIMITDLVRNDLGRLALPGSVVVTRLLAREEHPGLAHLVSTVQADLPPGTGWDALLAATFPAGSISGAPKYTALRIIAELEPVPRNYYCGALGYVDADRGEAVLAVGIRTFFTSGVGAARQLHFGTGAGITYDSDPETEWQETELKAARLIGLASRPGRPGDSAGSSAQEHRWLGTS